MRLRAATSRFPSTHSTRVATSRAPSLDHALVPRDFPRHCPRLVHRRRYFGESAIGVPARRRHAPPPSAVGWRRGDAAWNSRPYPYREPSHVVGQSGNLPAPLPRRSVYAMSVRSRCARKRSARCRCSRYPIAPDRRAPLAPPPKLDRLPPSVRLWRYPRPGLPRSAFQRWSTVGGGRHL